MWQCSCCLCLNVPETGLPQVLTNLLFSSCFNSTLQAPKLLSTLCHQTTLHTLPSTTLKQSTQLVLALPEPQSSSSIHPALRFGTSTASIVKLLCPVLRMFQGPNFEGWLHQSLMLQAPIQDLSTNASDNPLVSHLGLLLGFGMTLLAVDT